MVHSKAVGMPPNALRAVTHGEKTDTILSPRMTPIQSKKGLREKIGCLMALARWQNSNRLETALHNSAQKDWFSLPSGIWRGFFTGDLLRPARHRNQIGGTHEYLYQHRPTLG
ncbi:MAG: hypothetical protein ABJ246_00150 [Paracoccaceae bacterium]